MLLTNFVKRYKLSIIFWFGRLEEAVADAEKVLMDPTERFRRRIAVTDDSAVR